MLRNVVNKLIIFRNNSAELFEGSYDEFIEKIGWEDEIENTEEKSSKKVVTDKISKKEYKRLRSELISDRSKALSPLKKKVEELEAIIFKREEEMEQLNKDLIQASEKGEGAVISELSQNIGKIQISLIDVYEELEEKTIKLEEHSETFDEKLKNLEDRS